MKALIRNKQLFTLQLYNFLRQGSLLIISVALAKSNTDIRLIAGFETSMLLSAASSFFTIAALGHCLYPIMAKATEIDRPQYYLHTFVLYAISGFIAALGILISAQFIEDDYFSSKLFWYPATYILFNAASYLTENYFVIENKLQSAALWGGLSFFIQIFLICFPLIYLKNLELALLLMSIFAGIRFVISGWLVLRINKHLTFNRSIFKLMLNRSWPVMLSLLAGSGFVYVNQMLVKKSFDATDFAMYRYGTREFPLFAILTNSFSSLFSAAYANHAEKSHSAGFQRLAHQVFIPAILLMWLSEPLFKLFFNDTLSASWPLFNILLLIVPTKLLFPQSVLLAKGKTGYLLYASIIESITGIILAIWWIPLFGLDGAAWALITAFMMEKIILMAYCAKENVPIRHYTDLKTLLFYLLILLISFLLNL